jgi:hypothetical protein
VQGSLSEFRLAELLQLVAVQQKTGLLRLTRGQQLITFYFDHGVLVATRDRRHVSFDPLLDYVSHVGWLQGEMAAFLRTRMETSKEDLADVLLGERFLTETELQTALEDLAQELVHHTFSWREGSYQFIGGDEALAGLRHRLSLKIDTVLMEAARRADEWPRLRERLPGPDTVLDLARAPSSAPGERAFGVLAQINGVMRLGDLVRRARVPEFEVYEIVAQAAEAGVVRIVEKPAHPPPVEDQGERPARRPRVEHRKLLSLPRPMGWGLALGISILSAAVAAFIAPQLAGHAEREAVVALEAAQAREELRIQIEVYCAIYGRAPASLQDLVRADLATPELLAQAAPVRYTPAATGTGFTLMGPEAAEGMQSVATPSSHP